MILTSNRGFAEWGDLFGHPVVATALSDRLLHHAVVIHIEDASYRLRQHADLIPENLRLGPFAGITTPRRRGRPPKHQSCFTCRVCELIDVLPEACSARLSPSAFTRKRTTATPAHRRQFSNATFQ